VLWRDEFMIESSGHVVPRIGDLGLRPAVAVGPKAPLDQAARIMRAHDISALVVGDPAGLVSIVTELRPEPVSGRAACSRATHWSAARWSRWIHRWTTARGALLDMTASLLKEGLDRWVGLALTEVNARVTPPISAQEATRVYHSDRRLWPLLFRLERANRWWQNHVRRRPFEFLVPERTTYEEALSGGL
jgi:hypothetical protein